jgi:hypothetical protein
MEDENESNFIEKTIFIINNENYVENNTDNIQDSEKDEDS